MSLRYKMFFDNANFHTFSPEKMVFIPGSRFCALLKTQDIDN